MEDKVSGEVFIDVYLLLDKIKPQDCDKLLFNKRISLDMLIDNFDVDSYSIPDLYELTNQRLEDYTHSLKKQLTVIFDKLFGMYNADKRAYSQASNIIIGSSGRVWVKRQLAVYVVGHFLKVPANTLNNKIKEGLEEYTSKDVAGISPEFASVNIVSALS